jgi:phosphoglycerol transferase MdoB-like AlkP superfamily enzyme
MKDKSVNVSGGISLSGLTFIVFLVLKLCNVIDWSWWWVTAPLWGPFALLIAGLLIYIVIIALVRYCIRKRKENRRGK